MFGEAEELNVGSTFDTGVDWPEAAQATEAGALRESPE
jgi:hypothetical protein